MGPNTVIFLLKEAGIICFEAASNSLNTSAYMHTLPFAFNLLFIENITHQRIKLEQTQSTDGFDVVSETNYIKQRF